MSINKIQKINDSLYVITETKSVHRYLILGNEKAVLFDMGYGYEPVLPIAKTITDLTIEVILSHGDADHALGASELTEVTMHPLDEGKMFDSDTTYLREKAVDYRLAKQPELKALVDREVFIDTRISRNIKVNYIKDGDSIDLGERTLDVIHTPGHSFGHIMLLDKSNQMLFSGDQVTSHNIWYFMDSDSQAPFFMARNSLEKLLEFKDNIKNIYSAHGLIPIKPTYIQDLYDCLNGELHLNYVNDEAFNSFMGSGYQHFYKTVNLIYSKARLEEDFKIINAKVGGKDE